MVDIQLHTTYLLHFKTDGFNILLNMSLLTTNYNIQDDTNIMLFTFVKSSFSQLISGHLCTRPRNRAPSAAGTPAGNPPHADRTRSVGHDSSPPL